MLKKLIFCGLLTTVAAVGPAAYFGVPDYWKTVSGKWFASETADPSEGAAAGESTSGAGLPVIEEAPMLPMADVFRFNVTTGWILQRWPLASIGLADPRLQGYRVPLVTGTTQTDLAGSLTYYFDSRQQVQRITFDGITGDARELVRLMRSRYRFTRRIVADAGQDRYEAAHPDGKTVSTLEIHAAQIVRADDPFGRFKVRLILQRAPLKS